MSNHLKSVVVVGAGYMAAEYAKVLQDMDIEFAIVGRGEERVKALQQSLPNCRCFAGGIAAHDLSPYSHAIVAVNVEHLPETTRLLLERGLKHILLEKPGALTSTELQQLETLAVAKEATVSVGYNRRFFQSVLAAKKLFLEDGGLKSVHFEFTEWAHRISEDLYSLQSLNRWIIANSSHVIDLVFYLAGLPKSLQANTDGADLLKWHPSGTTFVGSGVSHRDIPFSYHSNWQSAGRWGVELMTDEHRLILKPMEQLQIQKRGEIAVREAEGVDYSLDEKYKPGLFLQTESFLSGKLTGLCPISEQIQALEAYETIGSY